MSDYGKGGVLGAATALPATSALGFLLRDNIHPVVLAGFFVVSLICLTLILSQMCRYFINLKKGN